MNLPNKLTVIRVFMVPFFVFFLLTDFIPYRYLLAFILFSSASYTDRLDGKIARRHNLVTNFGKLMDPLADKILVMSALICFVHLGLASTACVILIMTREFAVTSIRLIAIEAGEVIAANNWGKAKTVAQMVSIIFILLTQTVFSFISIPLNITEILELLGHILIYLSALITLISGIIYVRDSLHIFKDM